MPHGTLSSLREILDIAQVRAVMVALNCDGEQTRIIGGAVRNVLMERPVADIDLATTLLPQDTMRRGKAMGWKVVPTGVDHGTITVVVDGTPFEVTTLREDTQTDGRHAVVRFGRDFELDARRRDFTINALSLDIGGSVHDYCGGLEDVAARRIRFIGDARQRIREDYLRILRFFRFHAQYGVGDPDRDGLMAAIGEQRGLRQVSAERIRAELLKLLQGALAPEVLVTMADSGILTSVLAGTVEHGRLLRLRAVVPSASPIMQLAALAVMVREDVDRLRLRLRLSNEEHRLLAAYGEVLEEAKATLHTIDVAAVRRLVADSPPQAVQAVVAAVQGEPCLDVDPEAWVALRRFADGSERVPLFPLRGADFVARGIARGPQVGVLMARARTRWLAAGCPQGEPAARKLLDDMLASVNPEVPQS